MFGGNKVKLEKDLYDRIKKVVDAVGYSSVDEFVQRALEKELAKVEEGGTSDEDIKKKLQGLGYIS
jgi:metal-responsive CopG/Arc/MetJ family transcriptional regulator